MNLDYVKVRRRKKGTYFNVKYRKNKIFFLDFGKRGKNYATADNQF